MDSIKQLKQDMQKLASVGKQLVKDLPRIAGTEAVRYAREVIDSEGALAHGSKWPERKTVTARQAYVKKRNRWQAKTVKTDQSRLQGKRLLRVTSKLYNALRYTVKDKDVTVGVNLKTVPYGQIHNEGGKIPITKKMRKYFKYKFIQTGNPFWENMSRAKGPIVLPKREYLTYDKQLGQRIDNAVDTHFNTLLNEA